MWFPPSFPGVRSIEQVRVPCYTSAIWAKSKVGKDNRVALDHLTRTRIADQRSEELSL